MSISVEKFPDEKLSPYADVRNLIEDGDVLLCSGNRPFSSMIQKATNSVWSHVAFILRLDSIGRIMVLESVESIGVRTVRLSKYMYNYGNDGKGYSGGLVVIRDNRFKKEVIGNNKMRRIAQYAVDRFGYPYDKDEIIKIAARIMRSKFDFTDREYEQIKPDNEYICSEYVARCYEEVGLDVRYDPRGFVAPADFARDEHFSLVAVLRRV